MAGTFALNTAQNAGLVQVLVATEDGLFDYVAQKSGTTVAVPAAQNRKLAALRTIKNPATGNPWLTES